MSAHANASLTCSDFGRAEVQLWGVQARQWYASAEVQATLRCPVADLVQAHRGQAAHTSNIRGAERHTKRSR